jgi:hypothetical protein
MAQNLKKGQWYQRGFVLASITRETGNKAIAYVNQGNVLDIKKGNLGVFIPYNMKGYDKKIKLKDISINAVSYLEKPYMASVKGGKIAARENQEKKLIPVEPVYKVSFDVVEKDKEKIMENIVLGDVVIRGKKRSFLLHKLKKLASILIRESSFL